MTKAKPMPPLELIRGLFAYNPQTGILSWRISRTGSVKVGQAAGSVTSTGYLAVGVTTEGKQRIYKAHRIIWYYVTGIDPIEKVIDHIDGNPLNNALNNLRLATIAENIQNCKIPSTNTSGLKGAYWHAGANRWMSKIRAQGRQYHLGLFDTPELAHMAYCKAAAELHGEFARGE
jgi:hypothetical protein